MVKNKKRDITDFQFEDLQLIGYREPSTNCCRYGSLIDLDFSYSLNNLISFTIFFLFYFYYMNTYSNLDMKVKQLNSFNKIVEPIYQNFDKKYQDILLDLVNNWLKNNDFDKKLLADYVDEIMNEYSEYQSITNKWNSVRKINGNDFDNC